MELELRFVPNAFKHGVTEDEIWDVLLNTTVQCVTVKYKTTKIFISKDFPKLA
jgi:hypothetical protein